MHTHHQVAMHWAIGMVAVYLPVGSSYHIPWLLHITLAFNFVAVYVYVVVCGHKM